MREESRLKHMRGEETRREEKIQEESSTAYEREKRERPLLLRSLSLLVSLLFPPARDFH